MNEQRIEVLMPNGMKLVACSAASDPGDYKEIYVGLENREGWFQDLAVIGEKYRYNEKGDKETVDGEYRVLVYSDENKEDYTHSFTIKEYTDADEGDKAIKGGIPQMGMFDDEQNWAEFLAAKLGLDPADKECMLNDLYNQRGNEWLDVLEQEINDNEIISAYRKFIGQEEKK